MEKNIKEAISIIEDVRKSMPECTNKAFLKGALNELNEALRLYAVSGNATTLSGTSNSGTNSSVTTKISGWFSDNYRTYYVDDSGKKHCT